MLLSVDVIIIVNSNIFKIQVLWSVESYDINYTAYMKWRIYWRDYGVLDSSPGQKLSKSKYKCFYSIIIKTMISIDIIHIIIVMIVSKSLLNMKCDKDKVPLW